MLRNALFACLATTLVGACASTPSVDMGSATVGAYTFDIAREGAAPAAGVNSRFVLVATVGGMPTSIKGWVGGEEVTEAMKTLAVFDSADGDFDDDVVSPTPMPANAMFWFDVDTNGVIVTGSAALK